MILFMPKNLIPGLLLPLISYLLFFLLSFYHVLSSLERTKAPGTSKNSHFAFCSQVASDIPRSHLVQAHSFVKLKLQSSQTLLARNGASNNFSSKYRGQKNSLFTEKQQQDMHRSNNICPISAIWTVVCCVFDSASFLF